MRTILNTPFPLLQFHIAKGWLLAIPWYLFAMLYRCTLRVEHRGAEHIRDTGHILTFWHENLPIYFHTRLRADGKQVWMQHPALFMTPIHAMLRMMGVRKLAFGSSGTGGRQALDRMIPLLKQGYSTVITPDGPRGPVKRLKPGALIMAAESGLPIVPTTFTVSTHWTLPTWDRKVMPKPFSRITIRYGTPIHVSDPSDKRVHEVLQNALDHSPPRPE